MPTSLTLPDDLSDTDKATFIKGCIDSGMRETHCEKCGCYLLTRGTIDMCPPCRAPHEEITNLDLREVLHHCPECKAAGDPDAEEPLKRGTDNRHKPWCSRLSTKVIACPQCGKEGESNREDTELTCPSCGHTWTYSTE